MSVTDLIAWAWNVKNWQVTGGPSWTGVQTDSINLDTKATRFDITAKAEGETPPKIEAFRLMLRTLLEDRFELRVGPEARETRVYGLVIDKGGPKFKESEPGAPGAMMMPGRGKLKSMGSTLPTLANWFSNSQGVDRPVVDMTGLTGKYDFTLEWGNPFEKEAGDDPRPSVFTALQEQLGLKLEPRRVPMDYLVIDHVEMPGEN